MTILDRLQNIWHIFTETATHPSSRPVTSEPGSDEYHSLMESFGLTSRTHELSDAEARGHFETIMSLPLTDDERYNLLHALDVDIQNNNPHGMASPVIRDILEAQGEIVMKGKQP